jgi:hypothetical protein
MSHSKPFQSYGHIKIITGLIMFFLICHYITDIFNYIIYTSLL